LEDSILLLGGPFSLWIFSGGWRAQMNFLATFLYPDDKSPSETTADLRHLDITVICTVDVFSVVGVVAHGRWLAPPWLISSLPLARLFTIFRLFSFAGRRWVRLFLLLPRDDCFSRSLNLDCFCDPRSWCFGYDFTFIDFAFCPGILAIVSVGLSGIHSLLVTFRFFHGNQLRAVPFSVSSKLLFSVVCSLLFRFRVCTEPFILPINFSPNTDFFNSNLKRHLSAACSRPLDHQ